MWTSCTSSVQFGEEAVFQSGGASVHRPGSAARGQELEEEVCRVSWVTDDVGGSAPAAGLVDPRLPAAVSTVMFWIVLMTLC